MTREERDEMLADSQRICVLVEAVEPQRDEPDRWQIVSWCANPLRRYVISDAALLCEKRNAMSKDADQPRISIPDLELCERSAVFWARYMGHYASDLQQKADYYAIAAALLSAITGLAVWPLLASSSAWWAKLIVSVMALAAAVVAVVPKTLNYADGARTATKLAVEYGHHVGALNDALYSLKKGFDVNEAALNRIRDAFEATRAEKEALRPFPEKLQEQHNAEEKQYKTEHPHS